MKRLLLALLLVCLSTLNTAQATLTNSSTSTRTSEQGYSVDHYAALITATSNDTTANAYSGSIINTGGDIYDLAVGVTATNQTGTSPTLTLSFQGSFDNTTWFTLQTSQGATAGTLGTMASPALSISTASTTNVATGLMISQFGVRNVFLPPYIRVGVAVGGSATPGWTGIVYLNVKRQSKVGVS